ncbi:MAG: tRNA epoxyqueuosine(34) reductase QueG [Bacteroidota bacterium]|nr:tRNA epoxyqueuosine(34) reductase QueG [Bacteroidota bacterium]MDX5506114.1 tRNA epoxyqueuosine(34) reductase QueG [Bacteroidota bacterium]
MPKPSDTYALIIKQKARELGFLDCRISKARRLDEEADHLEQWLKKGYNGTMGWMGNHFEKRLDPRQLVPGARSVISLAFNYFPKEEQEVPDAPKIARYAYGEDYHFVLKRKLKEFVEFIRTEIGPVEGRVFVDSGPVMERQWAANSGLGWIGKNSLLLRKGEGSWFFLCEMILDLDLPEDPPVTDHCGSCTRCVDACPTEAILENRTIDASKCISYLTIELKDSIPMDFKGKMEDWAFGCDICQEVCPWNRFATPHSEPALDPHPDLLKMDREEWFEMTKEVFNDLFRRSAVKRTKYEGIQRNLNFLGRSSGSGRAFDKGEE